MLIHISLLSRLMPQPRVDVGALLTEIAITRASGERVSRDTQLEALRACISEGVSGPVLYRVWEEALIDGLLPADLDSETRAALDGRVPPEAASSGADLLPVQEEEEPAPLLSAALEPLWVRPSGSVREYDCTRPEGLSAAWEAVAAGDAPVLFRGVGRRWAALRSWTLPSLARSLARGMVRVSPGPAVMFCRESHPLVRSGEFEPPSRILSMRGAEFVHRLRRGLWVQYLQLPRLQALAPPSLMADVDFGFLPEAPPGGYASVLGRLWVRGAKRMLLWPAGLLRALRPYADDHPLARRLQLPLTGPRPADAELAAAGDACLEAQLRPGDVLFFPARWAHHTEATAPEGEREGGARSSGGRGSGRGAGG
ncbi:hypothetical protein EMIHUDRAFT_118624 [Emiliania huxleyi CCMP1516]|uniref:JmjC domain-containing protein n=2 Tax=Emiliania huxleyi TaxID=2903 RepID=A0A0D3J160_EMIH1|nr:hypothetical protein EMIHUDRAFT_118624 [Emiliania huxleyi CCMP1516]EOD17245.1 hypothetical protein EMIHUDRAFT_118624 [Emiliania huxleyi CCMP1516]|eukprot:XP_005769674.1 hypothetical protein EMIHUDRAFT_118624 [Emiliania huxleyi CCMP1516]